MTHSIPLLSRLALATTCIVLVGCEPTTDGTTASGSASESAPDSASTSIGPLPSSDVASETASEAASEDAPPAIDFPHHPAAELIAGSGPGYTDLSNWAPGICFPLVEKAYANSQVWRPGGTNGPAGGVQCNASNYSYPWQDNFCESRSWANPVCGSGQGHQGQDIRPETCKANLHWAVAVEDGTITQVGTYTVALTGNESPHRIFRYLHMQKSTLKVVYGQHVVRGQKLGLVSNNMGDTATTIHLHFEIRVAQAEPLANGTMLTALSFVPPYTALVDAYQRKLNGPDCPVVE
jgi:murein DD-endopeptidase MepM/ murein hydrolase activator NlpD